MTTVPEGNLRLVQIALGEFGEAEMRGPASNARILDFLAAAGLPDAPDETNWCSAFVYWCASQAGLKRPPIEKAPSAKSWLLAGDKVQTPLLGDIVVMHRGDPKSWTGHVGIFVRKASNGRLVFVLGGNQGNAVSIEPYLVEKVVAYQRL